MAGVAKQQDHDPLKGPTIFALNLCKAPSPFGLATVADVDNEIKFQLENADRPFTLKVGDDMEQRYQEVVRRIREQWQMNHGYAITTEPLTPDHRAAFRPKNHAIKAAWKQCVKFCPGSPAVITQDRIKQLLEGQVHFQLAVGPAMSETYAKLVEGVQERWMHQMRQQNNGPEASKFTLVPEASDTTLVPEEDSDTTLVPDASKMIETMPVPEASKMTKTMPVPEASMMTKTMPVPEVNRMTWTMPVPEGSKMTWTKTMPVPSQSYTSEEPTGLSTQSSVSDAPILTQPFSQTVHLLGSTPPRPRIDFTAPPIRSKPIIRNPGGMPSSAVRPWAHGCTPPHAPSRASMLGIPTMIHPAERPKSTTAQSARPVKGTPTPAPNIKSKQPAVSWSIPAVSRHQEGDLAQSAKVPLQWSSPISSPLSSPTPVFPPATKENGPRPESGKRKLLAVSSDDQTISTGKSDGSDVAPLNKRRRGRGTSNLDRELSALLATSGPRTDSAKPRAKRVNYDQANTWRRISVGMW